MVYYTSILVYGDIFQNHLKTWAREDISTILSNRDEEDKQNTRSVFSKKKKKCIFFPYIMWEIQTQTLPMKIPDNINGSQSP